MSILFGHIKLCNCLNKLGFKPQSQLATSHIKFFVPKNHKTPLGLRPFIMIKYGVRQYDKHTCSRYITEIVQLGFDRNTVKKLLEE